MSVVHSRLLPFTIGCSFQGISPALKAQIKKRLRKEGYRVHTIGKATSKSDLLFLDLIIAFIPAFSFEEDEAFETKCLAIGRLGPFDQVIDENDENGPTPVAVLDTLVQEIKILRNVSIGTAIFDDDGKDKDPIVVQQRVRKRLERDGFAVVNSIAWDGNGPKGLALGEAKDAPLMVMAYQNKKEFDLLKGAYGDDELFFERYERAASFLYAGKGKTPLYALLSLIDHYNPHSLEDALRVLDRRQYLPYKEGTK
jgi:hypothetical protein